MRVKVAAVNLDERKIDFLLDVRQGKGKGGKKIAVRKAAKSKTAKKQRKSGKPSGADKAPGKKTTSRRKK